jgi:hypothetical protein
MINPEEDKRYFFVESLLIIARPVPAMGAHFVFRKADRFDQVVEALVLKGCDIDPFPYLFDHVFVFFRSRDGVPGQVGVYLT